MKTYNRIMLFFWLTMSVVIAFYVSVKCITEGFDRWGTMYIFSALAALMFFVKRSMMKRYQRNFPSEQRKQNKQ